MLAFKKYIQRPLLLYCILLLVATVVFFPVSAADNNNEFFDFDEYAKYSYDSSTNLITADIQLPSSWQWAFIQDGDQVVNWYNTFDFDSFLAYGSLSIDFNPFSRTNVATTVNHGILSDGHFLDLQYIPSGSTLNIKLVTRLYSRNLLSNFADIFVAYVDSTGKVIQHSTVETSLDTYELGRDGVQYTVTGVYSFDSVPSNATGFYYVIRCSTGINDSDIIDVVTVDSSLVFNYSEQNYNIKQNQIIRDKVSNIDKQLGDLITGTPEQNEAVNGAVDQMQQAGDDLKDLGSSMSNVPKPDPGDINVSIDQFVSPGTMLAYTQPFLSLWENPTMLSMLIIVLTLVLVSWVMFGKKGG